MKKVLSVYTDGSHLDKQKGMEGRLGCGGVIVDKSGGGLGKLLDTFSTELTPERMYKEFGAVKCSNPSAELVGVLEAIRHFNIPPDTDVIIYADYIGVKEWMEGNWKIKEPYIQKIKDEIDKELLKKHLKGRVVFAWVKGHQSKSIMNPDAYWNNYVDLVAKGEKQ